ncbi:hypothetical protein [uncultured Thiohalocapsa sp.]|uniref:hypothetical protein n=1 Tax=uncultured Thiohalocapsa sp. TaxID=768990 RepID=UPI0025E89C73|nr:hypothetical protein [uncultured Thiohalocapsa sp.]
MRTSFHPDSSAGRRAASVVLAAMVLCLTGCAQQETAGGGDQSGEPRIVRQIERPLLPATGGDADRAFLGGFARGSLDADGTWQVRADIMHPRLRCATYSVGVRFGSGDAACDEVQWQTDAEFLPARRQCNNASAIHSGQGRLDLPPEAIAALSCARVMVRCTGACG